jgi:hypothetical protein
MVVEKAVTVRELIQIRNDSIQTDPKGLDDRNKETKKDQDNKKLLRKPVLRLFTYRVDRNLR